jgi:uncharacterized protein (DUF924 family)
VGQLSLPCSLCRGRLGLTAQQATYRALAPPIDSWCRLCSPLLSCLQFSKKYAESHQVVVAKWGRFPHRNAILGRDNTPEEAEGIAAGAIPKW